MQYSEDPLPDDLINTTEACKAAKCSLASLYRWIWKQKLRGWRGPCGRVRVSRSELLDLFQPMTAQKPPIKAASSRADARNREWREAVLREHGLGELM